MASKLVKVREERGGGGLDRRHARAVPAILLQRESAEGMDALRASLAARKKNGGEKKAKSFQNMFSQFGGGSGEKVTRVPPPRKPVDEYFSNIMKPKPPVDATGSDSDTSEEGKPVVRQQRALEPHPLDESDAEGDENPDAALLPVPPKPTIVKAAPMGDTISSSKPPSAAEAPRAPAPADDAKPPVVPRRTDSRPLSSQPQPVPTPVPPRAESRVTPASPAVPPSPPSFARRATASVPSITSAPSTSPAIAPPAAAPIPSPAEPIAAPTAPVAAVSVSPAMPPTASSIAKRATPPSDPPYVPPSPARSSASAGIVIDTGKVKKLMDRVVSSAPPPSPPLTSDSVPLDVLSSILRQVLREKCRCDVLRDAVCQPRASLSDIFWQWLRGRFGLKSLALEIRARVLHTAAGLRLASRFLDGGPVSPPSLLATLFMSLYANGSDVGSAVPAACGTVMTTVLRRRFDLGLRLQTDVLLERGEGEAILRNALYRMRVSEPSFSWTGVIESVLRAAATQRPMVPSLPSPRGNPPHALSEDGLVLALYDALKALSLAEPSLAYPGAGPNDRIADVDFYDTIQAVDASIEPSLRVAMFGENVQEARTTISRLRLGHYLRKQGLLSSKGFPKNSEQRTGPYRSTDADDYIQLRFVVDMIRPGLDNVLAKLRGREGTKHDLDMIERIRTRMGHLLEEECDGSIAWELFRTVVTAVDTLQNESPPDSEQWYSRSVAPSPPPHTHTQTHSQGEPARTARHAPAPRPSVETGVPVVLHVSARSSKSRRPKARPKRRGRRVEAPNLKNALKHQASLLPTYKIKTKRDLNDAVKVWNSAGKRLSRSPLPTRDPLSATKRRELRIMNQQYVSARVDAMEAAERYRSGSRRRRGRSNSGEGRRRRRSPLRSIPPSLPLSVLSSPVFTRSLSPSSRGRSASPTHVFSPSFADVTNQFDSYFGGQSRSHSAPRPARRLRPPSDTVSELSSDAGERRATQEWEKGDRRSPEPLRIPPPTSSSVVFSPSELSLLQSIANREVKPLRSCSALRSAPHPHSPSAYPRAVYDDRR